MTSKVCIKYLPLLATSDQNYQQHLQKNNVKFRTLAVYIPMQSYQRRKTLHFSLFGQYILRYEKKHLHSQVKEGKIHLKAFPDTKANQLYHYVIPTLEKFDYDCAIIHVGIKDILRSKDISELKDLPKKIMQIGRTCQPCNMAKVCVSSILLSTRTSFNIGQINEVNCFERSPKYNQK